MLSKAASSIIFWVFGMTRPGIEPQSPGPLVNTLLIRPIQMFFAKVMRVTNHTGLWDAQLSWYLLSDTYWICLYGLEHSLKIYGFRPTWTCLFVKVLAPWSEYLEPSGYCTVINCTFAFHKTNFFGSFHRIMAQFKFIKLKFPN